VIDLRVRVAILLISLSLTFMFYSVRFEVSAEAGSQVIYVPENFPTIRQAIDNASSGATIYVAAGTYREYLNITKSLCIVGENRETTIIDAYNADTAISINSDNVTVEGLTITRSVPVPYGVGIRALDASGIIMSDITITKSLTGLNLYFSSNDVFSNSIIVNNTYAVMLLYSNNNVFSDNTISGSPEGVSFDYSDSNLFFANTFSTNFEDLKVDSMSDSNCFYHNNFLDNIEVTRGSTNAWSYNGEGNYWSHYNFTGRDLNRDGIGDQTFPYFIDENNQDNFPLMGPFSEYSIAYENQESSITIVSNSTIANLRFRIGSQTGDRIISFSAIGQDGTFGFCRMMVTKSLMEYPLLVLDNEGEVATSLLSVSNETATYVYFTYPLGDQNISVISSKELQLENEMLDEYGKLQTELDSLNSTYAALLSGYSAKLQAEVDDLNITYLALLNSFDLLLQNLSQLQSSYLALNNVLQQNLIDQSSSTQNMRNLTYIFAATTAAFLIATAYLSTRMNALRKRKSDVEEER
jgi:parallel beta-helix repeat protein